MKQNILIKGYGSIGKKHHQIISKNFNKFNIEISSRHLKKNINLLTKNYFASIICSESSSHYKDLKQLLYLTKNILIEKPIFNKPINKEKINQIFKILKKEDAYLQVGYCLRFHPAIVLMKNFLDKNKKKILRVEVNCSSFFYLFGGKEIIKNKLLHRKILEEKSLMKLVMKLTC